MHSPTARMGQSDPADDDRALRALALSRSTGAPLLACLAGLRAAPSAPGAFALGIATPPAPPRIGLVELAVLADLALGGALRQKVGRTRPLPTLSLTLDLAGPHDDGAPVTATVHETADDDGVGTAAGVLHGPRAAFGHCAATFALPARGRQDELPWDTPAPPPDPGPLAPHELDDDDRALLAVLRDAEHRTRSWGDHLVAEATDHDSGVLTPTAAMTNRAGAVQGGVLFALAARRGVPAQDRPYPRLVSGTMRFLTGTDATRPVRAEASVEHATRRTVFAEVRLVQDDEVRAVAGLVHRH